MSPKTPTLARTTPHEWGTQISAKRDRYDPRAKIIVFPSATSADVFIAPPDLRSVRLLTVHAAGQLLMDACMGSMTHACGAGYVRLALAFQKKAFAGMAFDTRFTNYSSRIIPIRRQARRRQAWSFRERTY